MTPLRTLIDAVKAGPLWADDALAIPKTVSDMIAACFDDDAFADFASAYDGSLDAALQFIATMLPGYGFTIGTARPDKYFAKVWGEANSHPKNIISGTPARALLICALEALASQEKQP